jgi:hypothetical protein
VPDTAERLNALNRRLAMLVGERRALQYRWMLAATKANDWPDMRRAVEPAADRADTATANPASNTPR